MGISLLPWRDGASLLSREKAPIRARGHEAESCKGNLALDSRSNLPSELLTAYGTHRFYSDQIAETCRLVANLASSSDQIFAIETNYLEGFESSRHCHERGQISYMLSGMMTLTTDDSSLVVPAGHVVWIPAGMMHRAQAFGDIRMLSAYFEPEGWSSLPSQCRVVQVSDMFEQLLSRLIVRQLRREYGTVYDALLVLLQEEFRAGRGLDVSMPMPSDRRLRRVCSAILREPGIGHRKEELARIGNMSCRTMTRLFQSELNMTYSAWVQQALIASAVVRLAEGAPVSIVAADLGYGSPSAFTAMFRRQIARRPSDFTVRK